nr:FAD-dependent oxidoreductase [Motiliproteus sediminis]
MIIGAGPAGLTAAYEIAKQTSLTPLVVEASSQIGGLSRTEERDGNRLDIGGHRFHSNSAWVRNWWQQFIPIHAAATDQPLDHMLVQQRKSRILYAGRLFDYPLSPTPATLSQLGWTRAVGFLFSYLHACCRPRLPERHLEDFFINRFGERLYRTFFADYTEKVWGVPCSQIAADWGAERVKGISISRALLDSIIPRSDEPSLTREFWYPPRGPGQLWSRVADAITDSGGQIRLNHRLARLTLRGQRIVAAEMETPRGRQSLTCTAVFSSMPISHLVGALEAHPPESIRQQAKALPYRDFITIGLLLDKKLLDANCLVATAEDHWIYIQEPGLRLGRVQLFHNWSPHLVADADRHLWLGFEYFCAQGDDLWEQSDAELRRLAIREAEQINLFNGSALAASYPIRVPKAYPAYTGNYRHTQGLFDYLTGIENLSLIGRNGRHKYDNQDVAMLSARDEVARLVQHCRPASGKGSTQL